jgi:hypothetical protein
MQINESKIALIYFHKFFRVVTFQRGYARKKQKIRGGLNSRLGLQSKQHTTSFRKLGYRQASE